MAVYQTQPTKKPARLGAPQGAVTSGLVASACLVPELDQLAERGPVVCHGDDLLIAAKTKQDALDLREQLTQLLADHPAGPLSLKHCRVKSGQHGFGFDFLQYRFEQEKPYFGTKFRARPAKSAFQRMQCRVIQTYWENRHLPEAEREARVWAYAHRWEAAFKPHWDQNEFNYDFFLYTVEEALDYAVQTAGETAA
jgi:hypothetical protein